MILDWDGKYVSGLFLPSFYKERFPLSYKVELLLEKCRDGGKGETLGASYLRKRLSFESIEKLVWLVSGLCNVTILFVRSWVVYRHHSYRQIIAPCISLIRGMTKQKYKRRWCGNKNNRGFFIHRLIGFQPSQIVKIDLIILKVYTLSSYLLTYARCNS